MMPRIISRPYAPSDYEAVAALWQARGWPPIPPKALPQHGIIVCTTSEIVAAGFLYSTDSTIAILEFLVTNPAVNSDDRHQALDTIIVGLLERAKTGGFSCIFSSLSDPGLIGRYQAHGFIAGDTGMTNLIKAL